MNQNSSQNHFKSWSSLVLGLSIIAAGALLLAFNANFLNQDYKPIIFSWQMILIVIGLVLFFSKHSKVAGVILMLVGGVFILPKLQIEALSFLDGNTLPLVLILVGLIIIFLYFYGLKKKEKFIGVFFDINLDDSCERKEKNRNPKENSAGSIEQNYIFGGGKERVNIQNFRGGEINCVFGGGELDFTSAELADGVNFLEINAIFGGVVIYAPQHWNIQIKQTRVFGNFEDRRPKSNIEIDEKKILVLEVTSVFGGGNIKCL